MNRSILFLPLHDAWNIMGAILFFLFFFFLWQNSINSLQFSFFFTALIMNFIPWSLWILQKCKSFSSLLSVHKQITSDSGHSDRFYLLYSFFQTPKTHQRIKLRISFSLTLAKPEFTHPFKQLFIDYLLQTSFRNQE